MAKFRYVGEPVSNWYGLDLTGDQVVTLPDHLVAKAEASPFFEADKPKADPKTEPEPEESEDEDEADEAEDETEDTPAPKRRGRPRKQQD